MFSWRRYSSFRTRRAHRCHLSLPATLAPALRASLLKLDRGAAAKSSGARALRALAGFAKALKVKYHDIEVGIEIIPEPGLAGSGDFDADLAELLTVPLFDGFMRRTMSLA